ncbi:hypothetical protein [Flavobacterium seoulense]|nr:hypothetical protein [Flavobacterium seoulense]
MGQNNVSDFSFSKNRILNDENIELVKKSIEKNDFRISFDKAEIPKQLFEIFYKWKNDPFLIANPNEKFNATDEINNSLPNRQLTSIFQNKEYLILNYKHGGFGFHHHIIWCKIDNDKISDIWICTTSNHIDNYLILKENIENFTRIISLKNGQKIKLNSLCF